MLVVSIGIKVFKFQPTRPLRGATESVPALATSDFLISTHAPLAGRDRGKGCTLLDSENFNPRAPCGARLQLKPQLFDFLDFNPRAPCGARHGRGRRESAGRRFQPTRPLRGATSATRDYRCLARISTHAPLAGRDLQNRPLTSRRRFQPTRPLRGATRPRRWASMGTSTYFNPRAPCGARRASSRWKPTGAKYFNPRAPCGARQRFTAAQAGVNQISTHAPLAGRDDRQARRPPQ